MISIKKQLFTKSPALLVKLFGIASGLAISYVLAIEGKIDLIGFISISNKLVILLSIISCFGFETYLLKNFATHRSPTLYGYVLFFSLLISFFTTISVVIFKEKVIELFYQSINYLSVIIFLFGTIPTTLTRVISFGLNGVGKTTESILFNESLHNLIILIFLSLLFFFAQDSIDIFNLSIAYTMTRLIVLISAFFRLNTSIKIKFRIKENHFKGSINFLQNNLLAFVSSSLDIFLFGILFSSVDLGFYSVVSRLSLVIIIIPQIINTHYLPVFARLFNEKKYLNLKNELLNIMRYMTILSVIIILIFTLFGKMILGFWGEEFSEWYVILLIVGIGHSINASTGPVGSILLMANEERTTRNISIFILSLFSMIVLFFSEDLRIIDFCILFSLVIIIENLLKLFYAYHKIFNPYINK
tara:strand:- start:1048 stop:2295 length:1248 start_codon:yes stop_codon:yes gene_type:complete